MEFIDNKLVATYSDFENVLSFECLKKLSTRKKVLQVQKACKNREALFVVDSLPYQYRDKFYELYPDALREVEERKKAKPFLDELATDSEAVQFFAEYKTAKGEHLPAEVQEAYSNNVSLFNRFSDMIREATDMRQKVVSKKLSLSDFWKNKAELLEKLQSALNFDLPRNARRLHWKYNEYKKHGYSVFISGKYANSNSCKIKNKEQESVLLRLIGDFRNLDNKRIADLYNHIADNTGWAKITSRTIGVLRDKHEIDVFAANGGTSAFMNEKAMQHKRKPANAPLLYWTLDGWDVELYYQKTTQNGRGHNVTTYTNRVTVVIVLDLYNKYPIGYAIGDHETPELIKAALHNAIVHTSELFGSWHKVEQLQSDRYAIGKMQQLYGMVSKVYTPARAHNAKAKVIEPYFKHLNKTYCQLMPNWSGYGVKSKTQPNVEVQNQIKKDFPNLEGVMAQIDKIVNYERLGKRDKYTEGYSKLSDEQKRLMSRENYLLTFGETTGKTNAIEASGLKVTINGERRDYVCFDKEFARLGRLKWRPMYDVNDLSTILAVSEDEKHRFMLEAQHVQPMELSARTEADNIALKRVNDFNKELMADVSERYSLADKTTRDLIENNPKLNNTLVKSLICDSAGQHKDQRNAERHRLEGNEVTVLPAKPRKKKEKIDIEAIRREEMQRQASYTEVIEIEDEQEMSIYERILNRKR